MGIVNQTMCENIPQVHTFVQKPISTYSFRGSYPSRK